MQKLKKLMKKLKSKESRNRQTSARIREKWQKVNGQKADRPQDPLRNLKSSAKAEDTKDVVLGINLRNALIAKYNPRKAIDLARDKVGAKMRLNEFGIATTGTICVVSDYGDLIRFDPTKILPDSWAIKPARGSQGDGILLAVRREGNNWYKGSGSVLTPDDVKDHVRKIVDGQFAGDAEATDTALIEPLIRCHQDVADLVPEGLPDLRLISLRDEPLMAMMRLPTNASDGKANLHQHGIGAGVSLETGIVTHAMQAGVGMDCHPDTGKRLVGFQVPHWEAVLELASKCGSAIGLGYCGVDIVLDDKLGPLVLEINAHPGLEIQNINREGLRKAMVIMGEKL